MHDLTENTRSAKPHNNAAPLADFLPLVQLFARTSVKKSLHVAHVFTPEKMLWIGGGSQALQAVQRAEGGGLMERSREKAAADGEGRSKVAGGAWCGERGDWGAGGGRGQGYAGASARGGGIDGHISHSSVSRRDHRT